MVGARSLSSGAHSRDPLALPALHLATTTCRPTRHCERSEAIQNLFCGDSLDCFVAFAPRNDGFHFFTVAIDNDGNNLLDSIFARATDLPVVPICRS
jgi:hypothetical protein